MTDRLTGAVVDAAENVPGDLLLLGASAVETSEAWSTGTQAKFLGASAADHYRHHAERVARAWSDTPAISGGAVAASIRAAVAAVASARSANQVSLVWTGPSTEILGLRSTRAVVNTIVANAADSLVLVSFASYNVGDLVEALGAAIDRGVDVELILETQADGPINVDAAEAFAGLKGRARFYRWPIEARQAYFAVNASLHAKCIVADRSTAFITSANLTSAGINDNIELGTLIKAGPLPARLHDHLHLLIQEGTLAIVA